MDGPLPSGAGEGTRRLLCLARAEAPETSQLPSDELGWQRLEAASEYHQLTPLLFCRLRAIDPALTPPALLNRLRSRFYEMSARNYRLAWKLVEVTSRLEAESIPVLAYKGPAVALAAYGDVTLREFEDLDLLIRRSDLPKAVERMRRWGFHLSKKSFRPEIPSQVKRYHAATLDSPDRTYRVDLHWDLAKDYERAFSPAVEKLWERAERLELPHGSIPVMCREDLFLALSFHGARHRWSRLKWLLDVAMLMSKPEPMDWARVAAMTAGAPEAKAPGSLAVLLAGDLFGAPQPGQAAAVLTGSRRTIAVAAEIRDEILSRGSSTGGVHATLLGLEERAMARFKYLGIEASRYPVSEIFGPVRESDRMFLRLPQSLELLHHVVRPVRLLVRHGRQVARTLWSMAR